MQERLPAPYIFTRAERPLFAEVNFPKKIAYQGTIFTALEEGLKEEKVKDYLKERVLDLMEELKEYPDLLNPHQFKRVPRRRSRPISRMKLSRESICTDLLLKDGQCMR